MVELRLWAFSLCAAGVVSALLQMLLPSKAQNSASNMVINLFMLLCITAPLASLWPLEGIKLPEASAQPPEVALQAADSLVAQEIEQRLDRIVREKLQSVGIIPIEVRIDISVSTDSFSIEGIQVVAAPSDKGPDRRQAAAQLSRELGLPVTIAGEYEVTN